MAIEGLPNPLGQVEEVAGVLLEILRSVLGELSALLKWD